MTKQKTKSKKKKSRFVKLISESCMIIFSVLLALILNEFRNNYFENKATDLHLNNIYNEISENYKFIEPITNYHETVKTKITQAIDNDSLESTFFSNSIFEIYKVAPKGIIQGGFSNLAWEVAKQDKISSRIPISTSSILYKTYAQQDLVIEAVDNIVNFISKREIQRKELLKESLYILEIEFNELIGREKKLESYYEETIKMMSEKK